MTLEQEGYAPGWIREPRTADQFAQSFEGPRKIHIRALTTAYTNLAAMFNLNDTAILDLGVGTGQVEQMMRLKPSNITGIEYNPSYIQMAQKRLPGASFLEGRIEDLISIVGHFPIILTGEALDCISPTKLPDLVRSLRGKTDLFIAMQSYSPEFEFYGSSWEDASLALGGPGLEGLTQDQKDILENSHEANGITSSLTDPEKLLTQVQTYVEKLLGAKFDINVVDALDHMKIPFRNPLPLSASKRFLPAQAALLVNYQELKVENLLKLMKTAQNNPREGGLYISLETTLRLLQILRSTLAIDTYLQILQDACRQAGFSTIAMDCINASDRRGISGRELVARVNRSLRYIKDKPVVRRLSPKDKINTAFIGCPLTFREPTDSPFAVARIAYLTAA